MKQLEIEIVEKNGTKFGKKKIATIHWIQNGELFAIEVDFMGNYLDLMCMYDYHNTGEFINMHGNLIGKIIE